MWKVALMFISKGYVCDQQIMYWETYDGGEIRELEGSPQGSIDGMDISTDGSHFVTGGDDKEVLVRQPLCNSSLKNSDNLPIQCVIRSSRCCIITNGLVSYYGGFHWFIFTPRCANCSELWLINLFSSGVELRWGADHTHRQRTWRRNHESENLSKL